MNSIYRIKDLEKYIELLEQKVVELEKTNDTLHLENASLKLCSRSESAFSKKFQQRYTEAAEDCEEMYENYSTLAKECISLKNREDAMFEKYVTACQEKEKTIVDSEMALSHQRVKIKLLQETLTKRNNEYDELYKKNKDVVLK